MTPTPSPPSLVDCSGPPTERPESPGTGLTGCTVGPDFVPAACANWRWRCSLQPDGAPGQLPASSKQQAGGAEPVSRACGRTRSRPGETTISSAPNRGARLPARTRPAPSSRAPARRTVVLPPGRSTQVIGEENHADELAPCWTDSPDVTRWRACTRRCGPPGTGDRWSANGGCRSGSRPGPDIDPGWINANVHRRQCEPQCPPISSPWALRQVSSDPPHQEAPRRRRRASAKSTGLSASCHPSH